MSLRTGSVHVRAGNQECARESGGEINHDQRKTKAEGWKGAHVREQGSEAEEDVHHHWQLVTLCVHRSMNKYLFARGKLVSRVFKYPGLEDYQAPLARNRMRRRWHQSAARPASSAPARDERPWSSRISHSLLLSRGGPRGAPRLWAVPDDASARPSRAQCA